MTLQEFNKAMLPVWEEYYAEYREAWKLYPKGFYLFRDRAAKAGEKYHRIAAELWSKVVL